MLPRPLTPLIGHARELTDILALITDPALHLLTLTWPGGVGKTRLATEAASVSADAFADGVAFIPLVLLADANLVVATIERPWGSGKPVSTRAEHCCAATCAGGACC